MWTSQSGVSLRPSIRTLTTGRSVIAGFWRKRGIVKRDVIRVVRTLLAGGLLSGKFGRDSPAAEGSRRTTFDFPPVDRNRLLARILAVVRYAVEA